MIKWGNYVRLLLVTSQVVEISRKISIYVSNFFTKFQPTLR